MFIHLLSLARGMVPNASAVFRLILRWITLVTTDTEPQEPRWQEAVEGDRHDLPWPPLRRKWNPQGDSRKNAAVETAELAIESVAP